MQELGTTLVSPNGTRGRCALRSNCRFQYLQVRDTLLLHDESERTITSVSRRYSETASTPPCNVPQFWNWYCKWICNNEIPFLAKPRPRIHANLQNVLIFFLSEPIKAYAYEESPPGAASGLTSTRKISSGEMSEVKIKELKFPVHQLVSSMTGPPILQPLQLGPHACCSDLRRDTLVWSCDWM